MQLSDRDPLRIWHDMSPELYRKIVSEVFPFSRVVGLSCGAEPFMNKDFDVFLKLLWLAGVPVREVVTNGTLLDEKAIDIIMKYPPTSLFISIDGASASTHANIRGGADLHKIVDNLLILKDRLQATGRKYPKICFSTTVQKSNLMELPDIIRLAAKVGAVSTGFVALVPYEGLNMTGEMISINDEKVIMIFYKAKILAESLGIQVTLPQSAFRRTGEQCPYLRNWIYIDPDGLINPCPYWNTSNPIGDLRESSFSEILKNSDYLALKKRVSLGILEGSCRFCPELNETQSEEVRKI